MKKENTISKEVEIRKETAIEQRYESKVLSIYTIISIKNQLDKIMANFTYGNS